MFQDVCDPGGVPGDRLEVDWEGVGLVSGRRQVEPLGAALQMLQPDHARQVQLWARGQIGNLQSWNEKKEKKNPHKYTYKSFAAQGNLEALSYLL